MNPSCAPFYLKILFLSVGIFGAPWFSCAQIVEEESDQFEPAAPNFVLEEDQEIPLPEWTPEDLKRYPLQSRVPPPLGGGLWPIELYPLPPEPEIALSEMSAGIELAFEESADSALSTTPSQTQKMTEDAGQGGTRNSDGQRLTIPDIPKPDVVPPPEKPPVLLSDSQMESFLQLLNLQQAADPRMLFSERDLNDLKAGLASHSRDLQVQIKLLLLDSHERIAVDWSPDLGQSGFYPSWLDIPLEGNACLIIYSHDKPALARIFFFGPVLGEVSSAEIAHVESRARAQAEVANVSTDQLAHFLNQLTAEIFWIQQAHQRKIPEMRVPVVNPPLPNESSTWVRWVVISTVLSGLIFGFALPKYLQKKRDPVIFPQLPIQKRFGGNLSGGGHAWISFSQEETRS